MVPRSVLPRGRGGLIAVALGLLLAAPLLGSPLTAHAQGGATPSSGSVGPASGSSTSWTFDPVVGAGLGGTPLEVACVPVHCSQYSLTLKLPSADSSFYAGFQATLKYHCSWNQPAATDVDCFAFSPSGGETGPGKPDTSNSGANFEDVVVNNPQSGVWTLKADAGTVPAPTTVMGTATLTISPLPTPAVQSPRAGDAQFTNFDFDPNYQGRDALGRPDAGEPSLGVDWATNAVMYMSGNQVTRIAYNGASPPAPTTTDVTPLNSKVNEDAILVTDRETHRTWALGLLLAGSHMAYSDDDGKSWTPSVAFSAPAFPDHETLGSGPYHQPAPSGTSYSHAVYYCAQAEVEAFCGRSDDGGMTFSPIANALWNGACTAIHGHVRVGPTGLVYVPNSSCTDKNNVPRSGVAVSADNGGTFTVSTPPDSSPGTSDPSVMEGPDGTVYFGYQATSGHPMIATATHDANGTLHWNPSTDVGQFQDPGETEDGLPHGVQNTEFSEVITGDAGRAAFAFLGTGTQGAYQDGAFTGTWYLFVSYTFDGGRTWRTVNATPHDPVQRGCVWNGGLVNACRNMLDFNDIGIDKQGHVYVAYTDGCTASPAYNCDTTPGIHGWNTLTANTGQGCPLSETSGVQSTSTCTFARLSAIVRQVCGRGLVAASDPGFDESPTCPGHTVATTTTNNSAAAVAATPNTGAGTVPWQAPAAAIAMLGGWSRLRRRRRRTGR